MEGVLKKVDELGHFKRMPDFYITYCEFFGENGKEEAFNEVINKCKENGVWNNQIQQEFKYVLNIRCAREPFRNGV